MASISCLGILGYTTFISNCKNLYVPVYQRLKGQEGEDDIIKLIAYHGRLATAQPTDYMKRYSINDKDYFAKIIKSNNSQIRILENQQKVRENFLIHESSREREEKICQYIGIPILVSGFTNVPPLRDTGYAKRGKQTNTLIRCVENEMKVAQAEIASKFV